MSCPDLSGPSREALARHGAEVLRWNTRFSLISRVDPEARLLALQQECDAAFRALYEAWPGFRSGPAGAGLPLRYIDLGSGGGFPGLIWHAWLQGVGLPGTDHAGSLLVEPRDKRAWLLEQVARDVGWQLEVRRLTWGRRQPAALTPPTPAHDLITLKALRLTDPDILAGWRRDRPAGDTPVTICRFCSDEEGESATSAEAELGLPAADGPGAAATPFHCRLPFSHSSGRDALLISHYPTGA
ncbi:MAG: class I SAM-dependent methyltransferase [bacterium]|nr:class I SAM-dependent methyltransferase [bacterium]